MPRPRLEFICAAGEIQGARPYQEDCQGVWRPNGATPPGNERPLLAVLADGMGGHVSGEVASNLACTRYLWSFGEHGGAIQHRLKDSLVTSNNALAEAIRNKPGLNGMGCTLVAGYFDQDGLRWASVGDSALLVYRRGELRRLNANHSFADLLDRQVQARQISEAEARNNPRRRTLRSALTGNPVPLEEIVGEPRALEPGDWVVIASDGLETLSGDEIARLIRAKADGEPQRLVDALLGEVAARKAQHQDNTTVIAVKVGDAAGAARHAGRRVEVPDDVVDAETVPVDLLAAVPGSAGLAEHHLKARAVPGRSLAVRAQATNVALLTSAMLIVLGIGALALWKAGGRGPEVQSGASSVMTPAGEGGARPAQQVDPQPEEARRPEPSRNRTNSSKSR